MLLARYYSLMSKAQVAHDDPRKPTLPTELLVISKILLNGTSDRSLRGELLANHPISCQRSSDALCIARMVSEDHSREQVVLINSTCLSNSTYGPIRYILLVMESARYREVSLHVKAPPMAPSLSKRPTSVRSHTEDIVLG